MLYANNINIISIKNHSKLKNYYYSSHVWRLMYLINSNKVYNTLTKKLYNSSSNIPNMFVGYEIFIYSGLKWLTRFINRWMVGLKIGVFSWNRKRSLFKSKQLKKNK